MRLSLLGRFERAASLDVRVSAPMRQAMEGAVSAGDYRCLEDVVTEAFLLWHDRRKRELEALARLQIEIAQFLASGRPDFARARALRERCLKLLNAQTGDRHGS